MALLIDIGLPSWMKDETLKAELAPLLPEATIYCGRPSAALPDVEMLAVADLAAGEIWGLLPNLKLVQKLGAGVNQIVGDPRLPAHIRVARLAPDIQAREIAEYALAYVLSRQRNMAFHRAEAEARTWSPLAPKRTDAMTVGVLGLGHIGARVATVFASLHFRVLGWARSAKSIAGVETRVGEGALAGLLGECDYVVSVLPSTPATADLFDANAFAAMKPGAVLINVGRGDVIVDDALFAALDEGRLGGAVLDVFREEPLPADSRFWDHSQIEVTPHVSGWRVDGGYDDVAENYRRLRDGRPLLHEVDRAAGY